MAAETPERVEFSLVGKEVHRKLGDQDKLVALWDEETGAVTFANGLMAHHYRNAVLTFMAERESVVKVLQRADITLDGPKENIPKRPRADKSNGDLTPAIVDWFYKYRSNEFATRYGQLFDGDNPLLFTGTVKVKQNLYERNKSGDMEFKGHELVVDEVKDAIVTRRKTPISYTPQECGIDETEIDDEG